MGAGLYLAEGALANILADHVVADAAALRRLLLIVVSICRRGLPLGRQAATIWGRRRGCAVRHWVRRAGVLREGPCRRVWLGRMAVLVDQPGISWRSDTELGKGFVQAAD